MDSITKISLNKCELDKLVKKAFGNEVETSEAEEFKDGWFNTIYSLVLSDKREVVLKISPPTNVKILSYEKDIMKTEVEVLRRIKVQGKVPVPAVYFYDDTKALIGHEYFFMEKINGQAYNKIKDKLSEEDRKNIEQQLGGYNRAINEMKGNAFGYYSQPDKNFSSWQEAFHAMIKDIISDGRACGAKLPEAYDEIEKLVAGSLGLLEAVKEPRLVHWDLHDGNVIVDENLRIAGIIDCDRALWGDPLIELYFGGLINKEYFCKGYGADMPGNAEEKGRRILYNIYLYLIMVIECEYRGYDQNHRNWTLRLLEAEIKRLREFMEGR